MSFIGYIQRFLLPDEFKSSDFLVKIKVVIINIMIPISFTLGTIISITERDIIFNNEQPIIQQITPLIYITGIFLTYIYFLWTKRLGLYLALYTYISILYFSVSFYYAADTAVITLWIYVLTLIIFFFNKLRYAIINFFVFYGFIIIISYFRFEELSKQLNSPNYLTLFFFAFTIYSIVLLGNELLKKRLLSLYSKQKSVVERKNKEISKSLHLQEKLFNKLKLKEDIRKATSRDLLAIINSTSDLIWVVDENLKVKIYNETYESQIKTRYQIDEIDENLDDIIKENGDQELLIKMQKRYLQVKKEKTSFTIVKMFIITICK